MARAAGFSATALSSVSWRPVLLFRHSTSTRSLRTSSLGCLAVLGGPIFDMSAGDGEAEVEDSSEFAVSAAATERCPSDAARRVGDASRLGSSDVLRSSHAAPRWRSVTCREPSGARSPRGWGGGSSSELRRAEVASAADGCSRSTGPKGAVTSHGAIAVASKHRFRQVLTTELLRCGLDLVGKSWRRDFRLLFNSMHCSQSARREFRFGPLPVLRLGFASVNHFHYHGLYLEYCGFNQRLAEGFCSLGSSDAPWQRQFPVERVERSTVGGGRTYGPERLSS